ncbi:50S ribosomal protein L25 [Candidatus Gottesmanbacteria bacterium]|nr:50S ribosomal protein L25 [Candidatus Gottesmanbacteria bacterium]
MKKYTLSAEKRTLVGRKVKNLRKQGLLPATIYGRKVTSVTLTIRADDFAKLYKSAGETGLVELTAAGAVHPVLIHTVQRDAMTHAPLHVEFLQVDLKEKVKTKVPLAFTGIAPAVAQRLGVLLTVLDEVEVEALPTDLPERIDVDVSGLADVNKELKVSDVKAPSGVVILSDPALTLVKIGSLVSKEAEAQAAADAAIAAAAVPAEGVPPGGTEAATTGESPAPEATKATEAK